MKIFDYLRGKRPTASIEKLPIEKISPVDYDKAMFDRFYDDLKNNRLPGVSEPTESEMNEYKKKREKSARLSGADEEKIQVNASIPIEIVIEVEKIFSLYFDELIPIMGIVHWCDGARKELYHYKGYTWYTSAECYPGMMID